jgi:transposase
MRPVCVFANASSREIEQLREDLRGRWRQAARAVMVLLSLHGLSAAQIGDLLDCHPATVRRWIGRFNTEGLAGLADRHRCARPPLGGKRLARRIAALLQRPGPWTLPRIWRYLGRPQVSLRRLYRRVRRGRGLAAAQAHRPRRPRSRSRGSWHRGPADRAAAPGGSAGRR